MINKFLSVLALTLSLCATCGAQTEYLHPIAMESSPYGPSIGESKGSVFFMRKPGATYTDHNGTEIFKPEFILYRLDKSTGAITGFKTIAGDTLQIDSAISNGTFTSTFKDARIHFFYTKNLLVDSNASTYFHRFCTALYYQQLDTNLNVVVPERRLLYSDNQHAFGCANSACIGASGTRIACAYRIGDSSAIGAICVAKCMILDMSGQIIAHDTIPMKANAGIANNQVDNVYPMAGGNWLFQGKFLISPSSQTGFGLTDSVLNYIDSFGTPDLINYEQFPFSYLNGAFSSAILPSNNIMMTGLVTYSATMPIITKLFKNSRYSLDSFRVYDTKQPDDQVHTNFPMRHSIVYNSFDNLVYALDVTKNNDLGCTDINNYLELICCDTNLNKQWIKYISHSDDGFCFFPRGIAAGYHRPGVLISCQQVSSSNSGDLSQTTGFLFSVDNLPPTGISTPGNVTIRSRFEIYPNPATDNITIDDILGHLATAALTNMQGQLIYQKNVSGNKAVIPVKDYPPGLYLLRVKTTDGELYSNKVIIN